jgi:hypothetical protein
MALTLSTQKFLNFTQFNWLIIVGLIWFSIRYSKQGQVATEALVAAQAVAKSGESFNASEV